MVFNGQVLEDAFGVPFFCVECSVIWRTRLENCGARISLRLLFVSHFWPQTLSDVFHVPSLQISLHLGYFGTEVTLQLEANLGHWGDMTCDRWHLDTRRVWRPQPPEEKAPLVWEFFTQLRLGTSYSGDYLTTSSWPLFLGTMLMEVVWEVLRSKHGNIHRHRSPARNAVQGRTLKKVTLIHDDFGARNTEPFLRLTYYCKWDNLEPKWPLFWLEKALFWGVDRQK